MNKEEVKKRLDQFRKGKSDIETYDFREKIVSFLTNDVIERHIIYKAIGVAQEDIKDEMRGKKDVDKNIAYAEAKEIFTKYKERLKDPSPEAEADNSPFLLAIYRLLWEERYLQDPLNGDTMISIQTTLNELLAKHIKELGMVYPVSIRKMIKAYADEEKKDLLWKYISEAIGAREFLGTAYSLGNFLPVPEGFNNGRNAPTKDYWDLTLLSIYEYYKGNGAESKLATLFEKDAIRNWLNRFGGWDNFVIKNFMNPFVDKCGDHFGRPRELWDGHFTGVSLPRTPGQFEQFFVNAKVRILARGRLMAAALKTESEKN